MEAFDKSKFERYSSETLKLFDKLKDEDLDKLMKKEEQLIDEKFAKKIDDEIKNLKAQEEIEIQ